VAGVTSQFFYRGMERMMNYIRLNDGLKSYKLIPSNENIWDHITTNDRDWYVSIFEYNDSQFQQWKEKKTVSGIKDVVTNKLYFDFDNASNPELARQDAITLTTRLLSKGINKNNIQVSFSGNKGYGIEVLTNRTITQDEFKNITFSLAGDLKTFDTVTHDPQRIVRVMGTKHPKSGLYKFPLTVDQLVDLPIDKVKKKAESLDNIDQTIIDNWVEVEMPDSIYTLRTPTKKTTKVEVMTNDLDLSKKPRFLDTARWYLQNGYFGAGERNSALLCLAATYKNLGFEKAHNYRLLKGVAEIQATRNSVDRYSDSEIWNNIISVVYSDNWQGGQFSLKDENSWLYQYAKKYNIKTEDVTDKPVVMSELGGAAFTRYAKSFYETRIYTGLKEIDEAFPICAGSNVAIVGAASSGKTALSLNILRESNKQGLVSVFASLDMSKSRLYEKMLYSVTGGTLSRDQLYKAYINGDGEKYDKLVHEAFPNTYIFSKSSPTVDELKAYILQIQEHTGKPVRLLLVDYFERLGSEKSDDTAASKDVAGGIQDLISDFPELTPITLFQPNKFSLGGGPDKPILSYTAIKGSSFVYQSARQILSLWRPMFTPELAHNDKFMEMAILKNDLGELGKFTFKWHGKTGGILPMSDLDYNEYEECMKEKATLERARTQDDSL
jgi:hypothetical protein